MSPAEFKPTFSAGQRPYTYALDRAATGIGFYTDIQLENFEVLTPVNKSNNLGHSNGRQKLHKKGKR
jgi:hypothetical protein